MINIPYTYGFQVFIELKLINLKMCKDNSSIDISITPTNTYRIMAQNNHQKITLLTSTWSLFTIKL